MKNKFTKEERNWILYDVGNSAFTLLVTTMMPLYFNSLAAAGGVSEVDYLAWWGICSIDLDSDRSHSWTDHRYYHRYRRISQTTVYSFCDFGCCTLHYAWTCQTMGIVPCSIHTSEGCI